MVGYGEEAQTTLRRGDRHAMKERGEHGRGRHGYGHHGHHRMMRMGAEDRASVTTSIDSYPFSPSSPWAQALPSRYQNIGTCFQIMH